MRHRLSKRASDDLAKLYRRSIIEFGDAHAERYLARLTAMFDSISAFPEAAPAREEWRGLRLKPFEAHNIFYQVERGSVLIVRVLHGRQDAARHLK